MYSPMTDIYMAQVVYGPLNEPSVTGWGLVRAGAARAQCGHCNLTIDAPAYSTKSADAPCCMRPCMHLRLLFTGCGCSWGDESGAVPEACCYHPNCLNALTSVEAGQ